jgi:lipopolysaccharide transport system ATP-binding protein
MQRLGSAKLVTQEYIKDIFGEPDLPQVITEVDVPTRNSSATATPTVRRSNWIDYRKDRINNSNLANYLEISQFEEQLLTAESFGNGKAEIQSVLLLDAERQQPIAVGLGGENVVLRIQGKANADILHPVIGFLLKNDKGLILFGENTINTFQVSSIGQIKFGLNLNSLYHFYRQGITLLLFLWPMEAKLWPTNFTG